MPNFERQIESSGEILTLKQRDRVALRTIANQLARIETQLWTLGKGKAARHCNRAIEELRKRI